MGQKGKAEQNGLVELIIDKSAGGKNTVVFVTDEVNNWLKEKGLAVRFSRESIRRVIKTHDQQVADLRKSMDMAKQMAEVFKDNPGTEICEATLMRLSTLLFEELLTFDGLSFEDPNDLIRAIEKISNSQRKAAADRLKAVTSLEKAKVSLKEELRKAIQSDPELLERLYLIIDKVKV